MRTKRAYAPPSSGNRMGKAGNNAACPDYEPASRVAESVWLGRSSVGPAGHDPMASRKSRRISCLPQASLSPAARPLRSGSMWTEPDGVRRRRSISSYEHIRAFISDSCPRISLGSTPKSGCWRPKFRTKLRRTRWFETLDLVWDPVQRTTRSWSPHKIKRLCQIT